MFNVCSRAVVMWDVLWFFFKHFLRICFYCWCYRLKEEGGFITCMPECLDFGECKFLLLSWSNIDRIIYNTPFILLSRSGRQTTLLLFHTLVNMLLCSEFSEKKKHLLCFDCILKPTFLVVVLILPLFL